MRRQTVNVACGPSYPPDSPLKRFDSPKSQDPHPLKWQPAANESGRILGKKSAVRSSEYADLGSTGDDPFHLGYHPRAASRFQ